MPEPWLRGTLTEVDPIRRQVLHALELTVEEIERWCGPLTPEQLEARPAGVAPVAFPLRHIARSLDRLLTYAEACTLSEGQLAQLQTELAPSGHPILEAQAALTEAMHRIRAVLPQTYQHLRTVGREHLPTTVAGLLIHCAEHTQRHTGQIITTARLVRRGAVSLPDAPSSPAWSEDSVR